jgi:hypothetical protein
MNLPVISKDLLNINYSDEVSKKFTGVGSSKMEDAVTQWNKQNWDEAYNLIIDGLKLGLIEPDQSWAYNHLAWIEIYNGNIRFAVDSFLNCLKLQDKQYDDMLDAARCLIDIYSLIGRDSEAFLLKNTYRDYQRGRYPFNLEKMLKTTIKTNFYKK